MGAPGKKHGDLLWLKDSLLTNIPDNTHVDIIRKVLLMYGIAILGIAILILLGSISFYQKANLIGTFDFSVAAVLTFFVLITRFKAFHFYYVYFCIAIVACLYTFKFITGGVSDTGFMWYYTFPLFAHFLLGQRQGLGASLLFFIPAIVFLGIDLTSATFNIYSVDFAYRFVPSYLTVVCFAYMYERSREGSYHAWLRIRSTLEKQVVDRTIQISEVNATLEDVNDQLTKKIEERKNVDEALQESEAHFRILAENVSDVVWKVDRDYRFTYISPSDEKFRGFRADEVLGHHLFEIFDEEGVALVKKLALQRQQAELQGLKTESIRFEAQHLCKDGSWLWAEVSASPELDSDGNVIGFYGITREITERKWAEEHRQELEDQLRQKHKMEAVGFMAGGMAHNFNNNLSIILGNVELSQMKQAPGSEVISLLENAKIAVRRSRALDQKIITYSRKGITHKIPMKLTEILDETLGLFSSTLPATVTIGKSFSPDGSTVLINADASQIQEVLINLCNNAVQAMDEKGELKISMEQVELEQKNIPAQYDCLPGHYAKLSVQDSGCGMPAEMLDKIFDPFYSTKEEYEGAGMGLSTVQGIVAQHGGFIKVNSIIDQGTTFDLYFPLIEQTHIDEPEVENTTFSNGTECILFVDDDTMLASLGDQLLTEMGYQVSMMTDSTEALKLFTANADRFDLVITDQTMPTLTGKELIKEIKKVRADIPTILCTGYSRKIDEEEAKRLGVSAFLMKPLDLPVLSQTIRRVLDGDKET
jgi:PAS domain S-box-containing protein